MVLRPTVETAPAAPVSLRPRFPDAGRYYVESRRSDHTQFLCRSGEFLHLDIEKLRQVAGMRPPFVSGERRGTSRPLGVACGRGGLDLHAPERRCGRHSSVPPAQRLPCLAGDRGWRCSANCGAQCRPHSSAIDSGRTPCGHRPRTASHRVGPLCGVNLAFSGATRASPSGKRPGRNTIRGVDRDDGHRQHQCRYGLGSRMQVDTMSNHDGRTTHSFYADRARPRRVGRS